MTEFQNVPLMWVAVLVNAAVVVSFADGWRAVKLRSRSPDSAAGRPD